MKYTTDSKLAIAWAIILTSTAVAFSNDSIRTYSVPKAPPAVQKTKAMADAGGVDVNSSPVQWTTPKDWQELAPTSIRLGNFLIPGKDGKKAEVTITSFPGSVGGELSNVNRWRGELALPPLTESEISSQSVEVGGNKAKLYDFNSAQARTVVASLPRDGSTWFFKLRGDKEVVTQATETFREFLKSIRFEGKAVGASAGVLPADPHANVDLGSSTHAGLGGAPADPHAGIAGAPPLNAPASGESEEPKWSVPSNWKEQAAGMMVLKSFGVSQDGKDATVTISMFPGDVGGTFANVNRWRGQMGLGPIAKAELATSTTSLDVGNGIKGTLVDLNGTDARAGKAARLVAVSVPHGDSTWFYKLLGDEKTVGHEKEAFLKFVQTVRYP